MFDFVQVAYAAPHSGHSADVDFAALSIFGIILLIWYVIWVVQVILGYGTAYRKTKANGDNGVSLFGWMIVYSLAAIVPGLGIYLWNKGKQPQQPVQQAPYYGQPQQWQQPQQGQLMQPVQPVQPIQPVQPVQPAQVPRDSQSQNPSNQL